MEKMRATTNGHNRQRMIEETDMEAKGGDPAITITTKGTTVEARDIVAKEKKTTKSFRQKKPESTTHHQRIC
jgi:hypothetical protein